MTNDGRNSPVPVVDHGARGALAAAAFMLAACTWFGILLALLVTVPRYEEIFRDFGVALPWFTRAVINTSNWIAGRNAGQVVPGAVFIGLLLIGVFGALAILAVNRRTRVTAALLLTALCVLGVVLFMAGMVSMQAPLHGMMESLQGGRL